MTSASPWGILKQTVTDWLDDKAPRLGAALAFYSVLSLAPLLVIVLAIAGFVFDEEAARGEIVSQIEGLVGHDGAQAIQDLIAHAQRPAEGILATLLGTVTLLFGASGVFGELQDSLNTIWEVRPRPGRGIWGIFRDRFFSFAMVLGTAFLLIVSLVVSATLAAAGKFATELLPAGEMILPAIGMVISFAVITFLFAAIFKFVPDVRIAWKDVWIGAILTAALFTLGKYALGLYLGRSGVSSAYGAAGSLVVLVVWVYYSAQILFLGAELTQVYAHSRGSDIVPSKNAEPILADARRSAAPSFEPSRGRPDFGKFQRSPARQAPALHVAAKSSFGHVSAGSGFRKWVRNNPWTAAAGVAVAVTAVRLASQERHRRFGMLVLAVVSSVLRGLTEEVLQEIRIGARSPQSESRGLAYSHFRVTEQDDQHVKSAE